MAVAYVNAGTAGTTSIGGSVSAGAPAALVAGNLLVAVVFQSGAGPTTVIGAPVGWTPLSNTTTIVSNSGAQIYWKISTGGEGAQTFTLTPTGNSWFAQIHQFSGNDQVAPIRGTSGYLSLSTLNAFMDATRIPLTSANSMAVYFVPKSGVPTGGGVGWTQTVNNTVQLYSLWTQTKVSAGYSDTLDLTYGAAFRTLINIGFEIAPSASPSEAARTAPYIRQLTQPTSVTSTTSGTLYIPSSMQVGNVLMLIFHGLSASVASVTQATYSWNTISALDFSTTEKLFILWRVIDGTESTVSISASWGVASTPRMWAIEVGKVSKTNPLGNLQTLATGTSTTPTQSSWTVSKANVLALAFQKYNATNLHGMTLAGNWIEMDTNGSGAWAIAEMPAGGATNTCNSTGTSSALWASLGLEFFPLGGAFPQALIY